jgi:hypothetical protein
MKVAYTSLVAGLLMAVASSVAAQQSTVVATGRIEGMVVGENDGGNSIHVILHGFGGQMWELNFGYNINDPSGPGMMQMLLAARKTGARVSLLCSGVCDPAVFNAVLVD